MRRVRRSRVTAVFALLLLCGLQLAPGAAAATNATVTSLSLSASVFADDFAPLPEQVNVHLVLRRQARVTVRVLRLDGTKVRTFARRLRLPAGEHIWSWDGRNGAGVPVPDGLYQVRVRAVNGAGIAVQSRPLRKGMPAIYPVNPDVIVIAVDPGHGGRYPGATRDGWNEKDFNLDIGLKLQALLERAGVQVVMSRTTDNAVDEPPTDRNGDGLFNRYDDDLLRNDSANTARADVGVHVHNNAAPNTGARGTETYANANRTFTPEAVELAQLMLREEVVALEAHHSAAFVPVDAGVHFGWYYYLAPYDPPFLARPSLMTSVLSESLFVSNAAELEALKRPEIRLSLASAIYIGLANWLNIRDFGIGYELLQAPAASVAAGSAQSYRLRLTNRGNVASSGWTLELHSVPAVALYDGSGQLGSLMGSVAVPDGVGPGQSVDLTVAAVTPASAGDWLVKSDVQLPDNSYLSTVGVVSLQLPLTTTP